MKLIKLNNGMVAKVDDSDYPIVIQHKWYADKNRNIWYVRANEPGHQKMHRLILGALPGKIVDHINGDGLDNQRSNLRFVSPQENSRNASPKEGKYKGVVYDKRPKRRLHFRARICVNYRNISLGYYMTAIMAAKAYNKAAKKYFGDHARINIV